MKDYFGVDESQLKRIYLELRGSLDHQTTDSTIIVSLVGDIYVSIDGKEFKL